MSKTEYEQLIAYKSASSAIIASTAIIGFAFSIDSSHGKFVVVYSDASVCLCQPKEFFYSTWV